MGKDKAFENYWGEKDVEEGLENKTLFEGILRINPKNYKEAYITSPEEEMPDILIDGVLNRNRALNGDLVVCVFISDVESHKREIKSIKSKNDTVKNIPRKFDEADRSIGGNVNERTQNDQKIQRNTKINLKSVSKKTQKARVKNLPGENGAEEPPGIKIETKSEMSSVVCEEILSEVQPSAEPCIRKKKKTRRSRRKKNESDKESYTIAKESISQTILEENKDSSLNESITEHESKASVKLELVSNPSSQIASTQCTTVQEITDHLHHMVVTETVTHTVQRKKAKVVFIKERRHSRKAIGQLKPWPYSRPDATNWCLFAPKDHRMPRFKIPYTKETEKLISIPDTLYLAQIVSWEDVNHPLGALNYCVGQAGDLEAETIAMLLEHSVDYGPFDQKVLTGLPQLPWSVPADELARRRDFRNECIFTIDPPDARDLDDAVAAKFVKLADDGVTKLYKVSVHIADVSFFVKESTDLDAVAAARATSTYLVDRVIPMLPSVLCEHVCSLNPGEDRLAFSVEWLVNESGEILEEWFGRSVIRSCVKLSYDHAQAIIEKRMDVNFPPIQAPHSFEDVCESIGILQIIANGLRKNRYDNGALRIDLPRLTFSMDWTTRTVTGFRLYQLKESNRLIEEFMLLANMRVAEKIYRSFPEIAVLRCHPPPDKLKLKQLADLLQAVGIHMDISSAGTLQQSLARYGQADSDPVSLSRNLVLSNMLAKPMKCALYICSGQMKSEAHFRHFALNVPFYTHFTSPIRRYPDILVHRLLSAALDQQSMAHWIQASIVKQLQICNSRKLAAKELQDLHSELHLSHLIRRSGSIEAKGIVLSVLDHAVDIVLLYLGVARRLYLDKLPLDELKFEACNGVGTLNLLWSATEGQVKPIPQRITIFSILDVVLLPHEKELQYTMVLQRPTVFNMGDPGQQ